MAYRLVIIVVSAFVLMRMQDAFAAGTIRASFDCAKATSPIEKTICSDDDLAAMDRKMTADFRKALDTTPTRFHAAVIDAQRHWLRDLAERCDQSGDVAGCVSLEYSQSLEGEPGKLANIGRMMAMITRFPSLPTLFLNKDPALCRRLEDAAIENFERPNDIDERGGMRELASRISIRGARWVDLPELDIHRGSDTMLILTGSNTTKSDFGIVLEEGSVGSHENYSLFLIKTKDLPRFKNDVNVNSQDLDRTGPFFETWSESDLTFGLLRIDGDIYLAEQKGWTDLKLSKITGSQPPQTTCIVTYGAQRPIGPSFDRWIADIRQVQGQEGPYGGTAHFLDTRIRATSALATRAAVRPADVILLALDELSRTGPGEQYYSPRRSKMGVEVWGLMGPWNHVKAEHLETDSAPALAALGRYYAATFGMTRNDAASAAIEVTDAIWRTSLYFHRFGEEMEKGRTTPAEIDTDLREQADAFTRSPTRSLARLSTGPDATALIRPAILAGASKGDVSALIAAGADLGNLSTNSEPALFFALERPEIAKLLIEKGADVNQTNAFGKTALMYAAQLNLYDALDLLLKADANVNAVTHEPPENAPDLGLWIGRTNRSALMYAVENASRRVIDRLIDVGADVHAVDSRRNGIPFYLERNLNLRLDEKDAIKSRLK